MKYVLIAFSFLLTIGVIGQGKSGESKGNKKKTEAATAVPRGKDKGKSHPNKGAHPGKGPKDKMNNGQGHAYGRHKDGLSGREFGQRRAAEARAKHQKPRNEEEAVTLIKVVKRETTRTVGLIEGKILEAKKKLEEKANSGDISQVEYKIKVAVLDEFESRRKEIMGKLGL